MLGGVIDDEVEMYSWTFLDRGLGSMQCDARTLTRGWHQDGESVLGIREPNWPVAKNARPERHCPVDVIGTEHDGSEAKHAVSLTPPVGSNARRLRTAASLR
jgi:hypothetical protein